MYIWFNILFLFVFIFYVLLSGFWGGLFLWMVVDEIEVWVFFFYFYEFLKFIF